MGNLLELCNPSKEVREVSILLFFFLGKRIHCVKWWEFEENNDAMWSITQLTLVSLVEKHTAERKKTPTPTRTPDPDISLMTLTGVQV